MYLLNAPRWVLGLVSGLLFGVLMAVFVAVRGAGWGEVLFMAVFGGLFFGAFMGPVTFRQNQRVRSAVAGLSPAAQRAAVRATLRGPVPAEAQVRAAASRLVMQQTAQVKRLRRWPLLLYTGFSLLSGWLALTDSGWWSLGVGYWAVMLAGQVWFMRRLRRRAEMLDAG